MQNQRLRQRGYQRSGGMSEIHMTDHSPPCDLDTYSGEPQNSQDSVSDIPYIGISIGDISGIHIHPSDSVSSMSDIQIFQEIHVRKRFRFYSRRFIQ